MKNNIRFACRCYSCDNKTRSITQLCSLCRRVNDKSGEKVCTNLRPMKAVQSKQIAVNPVVSGSYDVNKLAEDLGCHVSEGLKTEITTLQRKREAYKETVRGYALRCNNGTGAFYNSGGMPFLNSYETEIIKAPMRCPSDKVVKVRVTIEEIVED